MQLPGIGPTTASALLASLGGALQDHAAGWRDQLGPASVECGRACPRLGRAQRALAIVQPLNRDEAFVEQRLIAGEVEGPWADPEGIVTQRRFFARPDLGRLRLKPDILPELAFGTPPALTPGALEPMAP